MKHSDHPLGATIGEHSVVDPLRSLEQPAGFLTRYLRGFFARAQFEAQRRVIAEITQRNEALDRLYTTARSARLAQARHEDCHEDVALERGRRRIAALELTAHAEELLNRISRLRRTR